MNEEMKKNIMSKIKRDEINIKSRWIFIARKIGLQSGFALTIIVLIFLINTFFYYIKTNGLLMSLHYGPAAWQKFLHSLPYDLILIIILLLVLFNYFLKKFDFSYKKPISFIITMFILFIMVWAFILFASNFNNMVKQSIESSGINIPYISNFYIYRCPDICGQNCK